MISWSYKHFPSCLRGKEDSRKYAGTGTIIVSPQKSLRRRYRVFPQVMGKARKKRYCCSSMLKLFAQEGISLFSGHASFHHFPRKCPKEEETKVVVFLQNKTLQRRALSPALFPSLSFSFGTFPSPSPPKKKEREEREGEEREKGPSPPPPFLLLLLSLLSSVLRRASGGRRGRREGGEKEGESGKKKEVCCRPPHGPTDRPTEGTKAGAVHGGGRSCPERRPSVRKGEMNFNGL